MEPPPEEARRVEAGGEAYLRLGPGGYLQYAREFFDPEQIDNVDESRIPGYKP